MARDGGQRKKLGRGFSKEVEAKRGSGQNRDVEGSEEGRMHLVEWIGVEHRKEVTRGGTKVPSTSSLEWSTE